MLKNAEKFTELTTIRNPFAQWLRNHIAPIVGSFQFVQDRIRDEWFELSINYRHSPFSAETWPTLTGGLAAGDRLCDAPLRSAADDSPTTLFAAIRSTRPTLLLLPGSTDPGAISQMLEIAEEAGRAFPNVLQPHVILKTDPGAAAKNASSGAPAWIDISGRVHQKLHANDSALFVVRPDGYIGYRCQPAKANDLLNYLGGFLIRKN